MRLLLSFSLLFVLVSCDRQQEVKHQQLMKQLADSQTQPIDGGSVRKSYKRVMK